MAFIYFLQVLNHGCIMYRVPSFLQPDSLIPKNSMHRLQQIKYTLQSV